MLRFALCECAGCGEDILSGSGITVTGDGARWHPACRTQTEAAPAAQAPKRRGRPPKVRPAEETLAAQQ